ncbi:Hypothetical predicted protein [Olea europaea subsp. europaea]|uniref:Uncharacterized protein n=1 Tax=Olea europaea subsp. europaea TaxID=158383 RepID=A0A8S0PEC7_OLEEU|nr:Hypothetical predicted protein [Olea europaea subsp. europaea]
MAKNQNNKNSKGMCEKIYSAVSGGRKLGLISHHTQGSVPSETAKKSRVQNTDNPSKPSHRMIPIEFEPPVGQSPMSKSENLPTTARNAGKDDGTKGVLEISVQETAINGERNRLKGRMEGKTHGQVEKVPSKKDRPSRVSMEGKTKLKERIASMANTVFTKDKAMQEKGNEDKKIEPKGTNDNFSDYIDHVKNKITVSTAAAAGGGGGVEKTATRKDSFYNKVSSYIKHTKKKIGKTDNF